MVMTVDLWQPQKGVVQKIRYCPRFLYETYSYYPTTLFKLHPAPSQPISLTLPYFLYSTCHLLTDYIILLTYYVFIVYYTSSHLACAM